MFLGANLVWVLFFKFAVFDVCRAEAQLESQCFSKFANLPANLEQITIAELVCACEELCRKKKKHNQLFCIRLKAPSCVAFQGSHVHHLQLSV